MLEQLIIKKTKQLRRFLDLRVAVLGSLQHKLNRALIF